MDCCRSLLVLAAVGLLAPQGAGAQTDALRSPSDVTETAPDVFRARIATSQGPFVVEVRREWAPIGADRFYTLVKHGFYDGARFFRVRPGFMAQVGLHGDPAIQRAWQAMPLRDDPVTQSNLRGFVSFTTENRPGSRFTQFFISTVDNEFLDTDGFAPFGRVVEGMDVVDRIYAPPREREPDQRRILREGNAYLLKEFPELDYIERARIEP